MRNEEEVGGSWMVWVEEFVEERSLGRSEEERELWLRGLEFGESGRVKKKGWRGVKGGMRVSGV